MTSTAFSPRLMALGVFLLACAFTVTGCEAPHDPPGGPGLGGVRLLFRVPIPPGASVKHGFSLDDERFYFDLAGGEGVVAHRRSDGERVWKYERPRGGPDNIVVHGGVVLFAGDLAVALDATSGSELWRFDPGGSAGLGTSAAHDGVFYFGTDRHLFALRTSDGSLLWSVDVGDESWEHRSIVRGVSVGGDTLYANVERYLHQNGYINHVYIFALDRHTGEGIWTLREGEGNTRHFFWGGPRVAGRWLLHGDHQTNAFFGIDRWTGEERWRTMGDPGGFFGPVGAPWVSNDTVFGASADRRITAMEIETGNVIWISMVGNSAWSLGLCGARVLALDDQMHVFDRRDGRLLGRYRDESRSAAGTVPHHMFSRIVVDGRRAFLLGSHYAYGFECPE